VAFEAKIRIALHQQFPVDRAVRVMAHGAALAQGLMLENHGTRLFAMALRAALIESGHGQAFPRFENVGAVWVMTLHAIHAIIDHRMTLRQIEFGAGLKMALKARGGVFAWIYDKSASSSADFDVFASRTMARLTSGPAR